MKLRYKIANTTFIILLLAIASFAVVLSHNGECRTAPPISVAAESMKAAVYRCYGSADVVNIETVMKPKPADDEVLVRVVATSVNPLDWHDMRGSPYIVRLGAGIGSPTNAGLGVDFAGTVEAVGSTVTRFKPGDNVFGGRGGAFAEYLTVREDGALTRKPDNATFEQAAAVPIAAITALQALRDKGNVRAGQKILINGASGGVGTFAVQIAKSLGAEVTGVCSTRNVEMVRAIGADFVVDYTQENYTDSGKQYDVIIDNVGNHPLSANRRALAEDGTLVIVGGAKGNWLGPLMGPLKALVVSPFVSQEMGMILAEFRQDDLETLGRLMESGKMTPVIGRRYSLQEIRDAIRYSEEGHASGKIIVNIQQQ